MATKKDYSPFSQEELENISQFNDEQQNTFWDHTPEHQNLVLSFSPHIQKTLLSLRLDKFIEWVKNHQELAKYKKRYKDLEKALDDGHIQPKDLNQTYANLKDLDNLIAACERREQELVTGQKKLVKYDSTARPGSPSIRPLPANRDFTTVKKRKV